MSVVNDSVSADLPVTGPPDLVPAGRAAALAELTVGVAHELNNPLFAVLALVDLVLAEVEPGSRSHRRLTVVRDTALGMRQTLRAVVDFGREPAGGLGLVDLPEAVAQTVELARSTSAAADLEFCEQRGVARAHVLGNRNQLRQAVLHLLANASAAMHDGGAVTVGVDAAGGWATVSVTDTGPGIPDELRERIFEPYFTTKPGGSGLGLAAAREIADRHGGSLELQSPQCDDDGASFVLRLPLATDSGLG